MHFPYLALSAALATGLFGCNTTTEQSAPPDSAERPTPDSVTMPRPTPAAAGQGEPVALTGRTFRLHSFATDASNADGTVPLFDIYLYPSGLRDSVLVTQDTKPSVLESERKTKLGVPATAATLFQTYYAGAGFYYYAVTEGNQLRIYRKRLEEATPNNTNSPIPEWQLSKTFFFFADGVQQEAARP